MTQDEINKMFEGRWRIKGFDDYEVRQLSGESVKNLCRDFFQTGIRLAESVHADSVSVSTSANGQTLTHHLGFDTFWNLYDKKVARPKCEKLWNRLSDSERKDCLSYIPLYKQAQPDKQYRKNPETFLRNKSWNDELIFSNNAANTQHTIQQQRLDKLADIIAG